MQGKCEVEGSALDARRHRVGSPVVLSADGDGNFIRLDNASEMLCAAASSFSRCESAACVTRRRSASSGTVVAEGLDMRLVLAYFQGMPYHVDQRVGLYRFH